MRPFAYRKPEFDTAAPSQDAASLRFEPAVLELIRRHALEGLGTAPGGVEVGGVLFGDRAAETVRVSGADAFACEHRFGPAFVLSPDDEARLQMALNHSSNLTPIGLYVSHCRRDFKVDRNDAEIFDRFFVEPGSVLLLVAPDQSGAAQAGFFVRGVDGILPERPLFQVLIPAPEASVQHAAAVDPRVPPLPATQPNARLEKFLHDQEQHRRISTWNLWGTAILVLLAVIAAGAYLWNRSRPPAAIASAVPLRVSDSGNQLRISWDPNLDAVRTALTAVLETREGDGSSERLTLPPQALRTGSTVYNRHTDRVEIRLRLLYVDGQPQESFVYFINPSNNPDPAPVVEQPKPEVAEVGPPEEKRAEENEVARVMKPEPIQPVQNSQRVKVFQPPPVRPKTPPVIAQPTLALAPAPLSVAVPTAAQPVLPGLATPITTVPAPAAVAAPAPNRVPANSEPARPRSGRLIWTGELGRGGLLSFTPAGASLGWLNGHLPGFPVTVAVHPAELVPGGLEIYGSDPKRANTAEPPSAQNGWNTVVYKYDPKRTIDLTVIEAPGPSNSWSQLTIQNGKHPLSVLVLDWTRTQ